MSDSPVEALGPTRLRKRALSRLTGRDEPPIERSDASAALKVLHDLASSPATAGSALALLHELQVHQVELELQDEELRRSRVELEASLVRQAQLYDFAPVAYLTVDRSTVVSELNSAAVRLLGMERESLCGRTLERFLTPQGARALDELLSRVVERSSPEIGQLQLVRQDGATQAVIATAGPDPAGGRFLLALTGVAEGRAI